VQPPLLFAKLASSTVFQKVASPRTHLADQFPTCRLPYCTSRYCRHLTLFLLIFWVRCSSCVPFFTSRWRSRRKLETPADRSGARSGKSLRWIRCSIRRSIKQSRLPRPRSIRRFLLCIHSSSCLCHSIQRSRTPVYAVCAIRIVCPVDAHAEPRNPPSCTIQSEAIQSDADESPRCKPDRSIYHSVQCSPM